MIEITLIPLTPARPGFESEYLIKYTNLGNVTRNGEIELKYEESILTFDRSSEPANMTTTNQLSWNFAGLKPYTSGEIKVTFILNSPMDTPALNGGDVLRFSAEVTPTGNQDNSYYSTDLNQTVVNSFDPNDKTCLDGDVLDINLIGNYVKYMIRFENTGSADAVNIVVTDTIDNGSFDINTLEVVSASHSVETVLEGNLIKFIFKDIFLPFDDANNDGYVTFKIKTLSGLLLGSQLRNKAEIFFDFNFPIITNTATTLISDLTAAEDLSSKLLEMEVSPNPVKDFLNISSPFELTDIEVYDIKGQIVNSYPNWVSNSPIDIIDLLPGLYYLKAIHDEQIFVTEFLKVR